MRSMLRMSAGSLSLLVLLSCGCSGGSSPADAGMDATPHDRGLFDAAPDAPFMDAGLDASIDASVDGASDAATDAATDASLDAGALTGFGDITGPCGRVAGELSDPNPVVFQTRLDFMMNAYDDPAERPELTPGGQQILLEGTAGGSSGISEAFAYEVLARCEGASLLKTETRIVYDVMGKITDLSVRIDTQAVGVSVTRAVSFPADAPYTAADAAFIERKLNDILESSANVSAADAWVKQILFVLAYDDAHADVIRTVWEGLPAATRADTILYLLVTDGDDLPIYF